MAEIMAMGKPVITNTGWGDVEGLVHEKIGVLVKELSGEGYRKSISKLVNTIYDPAAIRAEAEIHFSLQKGVEVYHEIYQQLAAVE